jgi:Tol biopolymer transport system component
MSKSWKPEATPDCLFNQPPTNIIVNGWLPVFSPDGAEVAFAIFGTGNSTSIWRIDAAGGQAVSLASEVLENYCPTWSPDGQWIAYQSSAENAGSEIWMRIQSENSRRCSEVNVTKMPCSGQNLLMQALKYTRKEYMKGDLNE